MKLARQENEKSDKQPAATDVTPNAGEGHLLAYKRTVAQPQTLS